MTKKTAASAGVSFYLGSNTPDGFFSLFHELYAPEEGWRLYIIKGGPGTGKSTLLKKIAAAADVRGYYCERIYCSSDPRSLDGVILPSFKISVADGTAPHVLEPRYPGVSETLVDLGAYRNDRLLRAHGAEIIGLTDENRRKHTEAARFLNAAGCAQKDLVRLAADSLEAEKTESFISHLCARELGDGAGGETRVRQRFLSAFTPEGVRTFYETAEALCERRIVLHDEIGLAASLITGALCERAAANGYKVIRCLCPLSPEKTDHLLLPELSLGVFTSNAYHPFGSEEERGVQCARFFCKTGMRQHKNRLRFTARAKNEMVAAAQKKLAEAKELHDRLERYYIQAMDFAAVEQRAEALIDEIFG